MGLTVTEDTPADMLAGNMELLVQLPPRIDEDYDNDDIYDGDEVDHLHQHHRNNHRHHNHHHNNGHHQRRTVNGNARRVTVARSTPMMDLLVQVATSQKLSASSYTLEAIGEHGLVLTHHPNTPIGALDALQVKLLPKQGTFAPLKTRHVNQPFEQTFRLQVHLPRNQLYVSRVSSRMNLGKILDEVCREKNLDRNNYELCHPANIEETLDLSLSLQDYHLQEVTLCPKRRSLGSSLSSQDIMALQRQEERRRQEAKQSVFGFAFKKSKESSLSTDSLGERSVSPARSDGTGRSASPQAPQAPTRPQRKRRPAPKPPMPRVQPEQNPDADNGSKGTERDTEKERENAERIIVISHSRNSSDSSGYHEASVLSDNLDSNIRVPETLPRRSRLQAPPQESPGRTLAESSQASKSLGNLAAVPSQRATIARGTSNSSLISAGLRKKKAAPAPPQPRPLSSAISTQGLERIVDSEESLTSVSESFAAKASSDVAAPLKRKLIVPRMSLSNDDEGPSVIRKTDIHADKKTEGRESADDSIYPENSEFDVSSTDPSISSPEIAEIAIVPNVEPASKHKRAHGVAAPVPKPRGTVGRLENVALYAPPKTQIVQLTEPPHPSSPTPGETVEQSTSNLDQLESNPGLDEPRNNVDDNFGDHAEDRHHENSAKFNESDDKSPRPMPRSKTKHANDHHASPGVENSNWLKTGNENNGVASNSVVTEAEVARLAAPSKNLRAIGAGDDADVEALHQDVIKIPKKPRRKTLEKSEAVEAQKKSEAIRERRETGEDGKNIGLFSDADKVPVASVRKVMKSTGEREEKGSEEIGSGKVIKMQDTVKTEQKIPQEKRRFVPNVTPESRRLTPAAPAATNKRKDEVHPVNLKEAAISPNAHVNDGKRSCAVISTIPKCDNFQGPIASRSITAVGEKDCNRPGDDLPEYNLMTKMESSLGSSFGSILDSNHQRDLDSIGTSSMTTDVTNSGTDDELELESFEMFEQSRNHPKVLKLLRSHSQLNDFEINTYEGHGRHLTSQSVDYTFALNPNLARNISDLSTDAYPEKHLKRDLSLDDAPAPEKHSSNLKHSPTAKLPAFLANTITWEKQEFLQGVGDQAAGQNAWTVGKPGSVEEDATLSTMPAAKAQETTSDLLKKVSDTLSGSLRSPAVAATSSLANEHKSNAHCLDQPGPGDARLGVNEAQQLSEVNENPRNNTDANNERSPIDPIDSDFLNNRQPPAIKHSQYSTTSDSLQNATSKDLLSSAATDWEYLLPEPPTAFRDTNVVENSKVFAAVSSSKTDLTTEDVGKLNPDLNSKEKPAEKSRVTETVKSRGTEVVLTNGVTLTSNLRSEDGGRRSRTISASSSEIGSDLAVDRARLSRTGVKSSGDAESRRGSQAASTPSVAPVDNTLSNFVITTYSRPKNVDIFNEIERVVREPQVIIGRKNSTGNSGHGGGGFVDSRKSSTISLQKDVAQPRNNAEEKSGAVVSVQKISQLEVLQKNNDLQLSEGNDTPGNDGDLCNTLNRSNIKISIASKPRPRGDSINDNQRPKPVFVSIGSDDSSNSREDIKPVEETSLEPVAGGNKKLSQWRENILNKQEPPTTEKQLQSLQVLRSILPQLDGTRRTSDDSSVTEKPSLNPSEEPRVSAPLPNNDNTPTEPSLQQTLTVSTSNEPRAKRYTYAGPPAINLGSWSDRSRTTKVQIKADNDYKFEKSRTPEAGINETPVSLMKENNTVVSKSIVTVTTVKNPQTISSRSEKEPVIDNRDKREPNELAKTLIARTTAGGYKRPVSAIVESSGTILRSKKEDDLVSQKMNVEKEACRKSDGFISGGNEKRGEKVKEEEKEEEVDTRPRNFKELKEAFAKEQNTNLLSMPKYGTYGRRQENSIARSTDVRRDSFPSSNDNHENPPRKETPVDNSRVNKPAVSVQDKRNFVVIPPANNRSGVQDVVRRSSKGTLMPVVKGFKIATPTPDDEASTFSQEKRTGYRVAIGDISNGNYVSAHNGLRKTVHVKVEDFSSVVPKPPPTMPVITGVTLKSTNHHTNPRPKSMPTEPDTRNELLESIRNFGGQNQLKRAPRRNVNITGAPGSRSVRS